MDEPIIMDGADVQFCENCGGHPTESMYLVNGKIVCEQCYTDEQYNKIPNFLKNDPEFAGKEAMRGYWITSAEAVEAIMERKACGIALDFVNHKITELEKEQTNEAKNLVLALNLSKALLEDKIQEENETIRYCKYW